MLPHIPITNAGKNLCDTLTAFPDTVNMQFSGSPLSRDVSDLSGFNALPTLARCIQTQTNS